MSNAAKSNPPASVVCRRPSLQDAAAVHALVESCKPLDLNSPYAYMLLCTHFAASCVLAERDGAIAGFVSSYRKPREDTVLFVWQVAVSAAARGLGLASHMLDELLAREAAQGIRFVETTITPTNKASWALFQGFAKRHGARCESKDFFLTQHFGGNSHEEERLLRIGPL